MAKHWEFHPSVRTGKNRTIGERAADTMRLGMGTWTFLGTFLTLMTFWIINSGFGTDPAPFFRLNLLLSMLAGLQGSVLLIAAKRSDKISAELQEFHLKTTLEHAEMLSDIKQIIDNKKSEMETI
jgi:uncharacterized membrane protein